MPDIPITSTFGYLSAAFLLLSAFLFLSGLGIINMRSISVKKGKRTTLAGLPFLVVGILFLIIDFRNTQLANMTIGNQPSSTETGNATLILTQAQNWSLKFEDDFQGNKVDWLIGKGVDTFGSYDLEIEPGNYNWKVINIQHTSWHRVSSLPMLDPFDSFYLAVDCTFVKLTNWSNCGFVFRSQGTEKYYYVIVYPHQQWFSVGYRDKSINKLETLLDLPNTAINASGTNHIEMIGISSDYWFFDNKAYLGHVLDPRLTVGLVGLYGGLGDENLTPVETDLHFNNFIYRSTP